MVIKLILNYECLKKKKKNHLSFIQPNLTTHLFKMNFVALLYVVKPPWASLRLALQVAEQNPALYLA